MVEIQERVSSDIDAVAVRALVASSRSQVQAVTTPEFSRRRLMMPVVLRVAVVDTPILLSQLKRRESLLGVTQPEPCGSVWGC